MSFFYEKRDYNYEAFFVDMDFVPHMHEEIEIMYVCEGIVDTKIGNCQKMMAPASFPLPSLTSYTATAAQEFPTICSQ